MSAQILPPLGGDVKKDEIEVDFQPGIPLENTDSSLANLLDTSTITYEKDVFFGVLPGIEGKYYGPYLKSSLLQFAHSDGTFQFYTNFTIGSEIIMNGASSFWVRVPIVPTEYQWWHLWCDWGYYGSIEETGEAINDRFFNAMMPWPNPDWDSVMVDYDQPYYDPGNVWSTNTSSTYQLRESNTGLYIRYDGIFKPSQQFTMMFTGKLKPGAAPSIFVTQERLNLSLSQKYRFFEPYLVRQSGVAVDWGYKYDYNESIPLDPAWIFVFTSGLGREGMTSYRFMLQNTTNDYIQWGGFVLNGSMTADRFHTFFQHSYFSFYMPFTALSISDNFKVTAESTITWRVTLDLRTSVSGSMPLFELGGSSTTDIITFDVTSCANYLLFSSPYSINDSIGGGTPDHQSIIITLRTVEPCEILLLGADLDQEHVGSTPYAMDQYWAYYHHESERAKWNTSVSVNAHAYPLFISGQFTTGRWASVTPGKLYWNYDFGWGMGYWNPGQTQIYMFLDSGGKIFYNGSYAKFADQWNSPSVLDVIPTTIAELWQKVKEFGAKIVGTIWDGIVTVWETLKSVAKWIYTTITELIGWIISVAKDIADKVSHVVEGMLYGMPILVLLFVVSYVGDMLYKGHIPKATKERRLLKKLMPRAILRRRARYQRKLKIPVIDLKKEIALRKRLKTERQQAATRSYKQTLAEERQREQWRNPKGFKAAMESEEFRRRREASFSSRRRYYGRRP